MNDKEQCEFCKNGCTFTSEKCWCSCHTEKKVEIMEHYTDDKLVQVFIGGKEWYSPESVARLLKERDETLKEKIKNSPKTFGIIDNEGKGGAILVEDVIDLLNER